MNVTSAERENWMRNNKEWATEPIRILYRNDDSQKTTHKRKMNMYEEETEKKKEN